MDIQVRLLQQSDEAILKNVDDDVFDHAINDEWSKAFLQAPNHHIAVALDGNVVVGMATAMHYFHPDKPPELYINEVGVSESYQRRGLGKRLMEALFNVGKQHSCKAAWLLTERTNPKAMRFYEAFADVEGPNDAIVYAFDL